MIRWMKLVLRYLKKICKNYDWHCISSSIRKSNPAAIHPIRVNKTPFASHPVPSIKPHCSPTRAFTKTPMFTTPSLQDSDSDDENDTEELMAELNRIKKERAQETAKREAVQVRGG